MNSQPPSIAPRSAATTIRPTERLEEREAAARKLGALTECYEIADSGRHFALVASVGGTGRATADTPESARSTALDMWEARLYLLRRHPCQTTN